MLAYLMDWCLTKPRHGFRNLNWFLATYVTFGVGEMHVYQPYNKYASQQLDLLCFMVMKRGILSKLLASISTN